MRREMREGEMDDGVDLDPAAEAAGRRLLTAAFEATPDDGLTPGELLRGVRRRTSRQRRRLRTLVPAGAVAALGGAAALVLALTVANAPSALAAVTAAAAKTSAGSFQVTMIASQTDTLGPGDDGTPTRMTGVFDLGRGLGEETMTQVPHIRIVGGHIYLELAAGSGWGFTDLEGRPWVEALPSPSLALGDSTDISQGFAGDEPINPRALLGLLESAGSVTATGPVAGSGWTGTEYAFTEQLPSGEDAPIIVRGTVSVDSQGRVRRLMTAQTRVIWSSEGVKGSATEHYDVTFGDFGVPVSVAAPPASQVDNLGDQYVFLGPGGPLYVAPRR